MENPIKMDDLGDPYFWKHPYELLCSSYTRMSAYQLILLKLRGAQYYIE